MASQVMYLDTSRFMIPESQLGEMQLMFSEAFSRMQEAFSGTNIQLVLQKPECGEFSTIHITTDYPEGNGVLGLAHQDSLAGGDPNDIGMINFNELQSKYDQYQMTFNERINLFTNSVQHEVGHLMGLEHTDDPADIMHDGLTQGMWETHMHFSPSQIMDINYMIDLTSDSPDYSNDHYHSNHQNSEFLDNYAVYGHEYFGDNDLESDANGDDASDINNSVS